MSEQHKKNEKNFLIQGSILAIAGVLIQIVIALPAGYAIARIPSPKAQTFFLLTCVFFLLLPQQALMLPQYLVLMNSGWIL